MHWGARAMQQPPFVSFSGNKRNPSPSISKRRGRLLSSHDTDWGVMSLFGRKRTDALPAGSE